MSNARVKNTAEQIRQQVKQDLRMGREYQQGRVNWITTIVMGLFHILALAALFFASPGRTSASSPSCTSWPSTSASVSPIIAC